MGFHAWEKQLPPRENSFADNCWNLFLVLICQYGKRRDAERGNLILISPSAFLVRAVVNLRLEMVMYAIFRAGYVFSEPFLQVNFPIFRESVHPK